MKSTYSGKANKLIKSKERKAKYGEVFTPAWMVQKMLDVDGVRECTYDIDKTFLEPSCGEGAFLTAILERKLHTVDKLSKDKLKRRRMALRSLQSIYAVELLEDNLEIAKENMRNVFRKHGYRITKKVNEILDENLKQGNMLKDEFHWKEWKD